ncbi:MAG: hypothetical protein WC782_16145 [Methylococcaceae bacterium]
MAALNGRELVMACSCKFPVGYMFSSITWGVCLPVRCLLHSPGINGSQLLVLIKQAYLAVDAQG